MISTGPFSPCTLILIGQQFGRCNAIQRISSPDNGPEICVGGGGRVVVRAPDCVDCVPVSPSQKAKSQCTEFSDNGTCVTPRVTPQSRERLCSASRARLAHSPQFGALLCR